MFSDDELPSNLEAWEVAAASDVLIADVVFNRPLTTVYQYLVPEPLRDLVGPGQRVQVPFGRGSQLTIGYCVGLGTTLPTGRALKSVESLIDREALIDERMLSLTKWIADRYLCGWGQVLDSVIPKGVKTNAGTRDVTSYTLGKQLVEKLGLLHESPPTADTVIEPASESQKRSPSPERVTEVLNGLKLRSKQRTIVEILIAAGRPMPVDELSAAAQCGISPIHSLRDKQYIVPQRNRVLTSLPSVVAEPHREVVMNEDQSRAIDTILEVVRSGEYKTLLLHGVTGSGKTEVYIRAIQEVVSYGRQAIVLVPEISLTPQTIRRFRSRFNSVAVLHSHLTDAERHSYWKQISSGAVEVIVGARSAVFAPAPQLGMIVIDEEHETSFKQDSTPRYHACEVARRRAELERIPLVLGSATPTLESWQRVIDGHDTLISMPRRVESLPLPPVVIVDTRNDPAIAKGAAIGRSLFQAMNLALKDQGQVILFLNVRGYSTVLWCRQCGEGVRCPDCDVTLTWHKAKAIVLCHSCGFSTKPPSTCPNCGQRGLAYLGTGTERLENEVRTRFSEYRCLRMDSDTMQKRGAHDDALEQFRHGKVQILLGTQMIAKGLDFPNVTLVGVVDADTLLHQPDLRSAERTFQLIAQVAGRTGRSMRGGRVLVQTACPTQYAIQRAARHDFEGFAKEELAHRIALKVPPFTHLARIILRGPDEKEVKEYSAVIGELLRKTAKELEVDVRILGPAPCQVTKLKANFRFNIQMSSPQLEHLHSVWIHGAPQFPNHPTVEYQVDVDPLNSR